VPVTGLRSKEFAEARRALISLDRAMDGPAPGDVWAFNDTAGQPLSSSYATDWGSSDEHTTHFCVVDKDRTIVSMTQSIIGSFGSKVVVPGTGFLFNNRLRTGQGWSCGTSATLMIFRVSRPKDRSRSRARVGIFPDQPCC